MEKEIIESLFRKYLDNQCSPDEVDRLMELLERPENKDLEKELVMFHLASDPGAVHPGNALLREKLDGRFKDVMQRIHTRQPAVARPARLYLLRAAAAAVVILLLGSAAYFFLLRRSSAGVAEVVKQEKQSGKDAAPGGNKAVLTLGNGGRIILDSTAEGVLAKQGNTSILKQGNGQLAYKGSDEKTTEVIYNTLSTPPGGQYQLVLADGTKVWLDAASSISYPTAFTGPERRVTITGQAYFEVARNEKLPFIVQKGKVSVQVLGTHFNVNAYDDESVIKTTLLEGSVSISDGASKSVLKPGQQMEVAKNGEFRLTGNADLEEAVAWKNGFFRFSHCDLQTVMRQLARWYDVEVVYQGKIPPLQFGGKLERDLNLSEVLEGLEKSLVHFKIENKKLIVMP